MRDMAVYATRGEQAVQMQFFAVFLNVVHNFYERGVSEKFAVTDFVSYARKFLTDYSARADIEVPDFAVTHLTFGQADVFAAGAKLCVRVFCGKAFDNARVCSFDCVTPGFGVNSVSVHYKKTYRSCFHFHDFSPFENKFEKLLLT